ncbi:MAG: cation:proton antiporter [Chitinophagaceae bacterium]|jgi:CPA2 family monovalent cation:H+ antiporter-2|nr:cation:proton antiporter [Chitinophagaceae bacterium]
MGHLPKLIEDLALILIAGAITTLLFRWIKQPLILGYILAGFLVGPHFKYLPSVSDITNVETWAEIGVIFLLFSLGLEFSFKKLMRVGGAASITAFVEIIFITSLGFLVGNLMGWSMMDSLFLGGMLAAASTTIIFRAFDELGVKTKQFARVVFGVLVVEDIVVILLMVLLSTIAVSNQFQGAEMIMTVVKLVFFLILWFITGIFLLPTFLKMARKLIDEEALLILSIGLCLGMVVVATQVGFSAELGAFIMGSIIAETTSAEKVEHIFKPVKDLFGAVFFISVGMMINPTEIMENGLAVIIVSLLIIFGKSFGVTMGALLSGQPLKQSLQVGMSMTMIGEFSFIVAALGLSLGVISDFLFPVAVGASAITTFTAPYMMKSSEQVYNFLVKILPPRLLKNLNRYSAGTRDIQAESNWKTVLRAYSRIAFINAFVLLALGWLSYRFLVPFLYTAFTDSNAASVIGVVVVLGMASPFLWALMAKKPEVLAYKELWLINKYNHGPLVMLEVLRILMGITLIVVGVDILFSAKIAMLVAVPIIIVILFLFSKRIQKFYHRIELRFLSNFNERELAVRSQKDLVQVLYSKSRDIQSDLSPWSASIIDMEVNPEADYIGKTLQELAWREKYGINVGYIKRGDRLIHTPGRNNKLLPYDHAGIIATDEQMLQFQPVFDTTEPIEESTIDIEDIMLQKIVVNEHTRLKGLTIRNSGIRELTSGLVIGIERSTGRILNPDSNTVFEWNDIVWIVGERKKIQQLGKIKLQGSQNQA